MYCEASVAPLPHSPIRTPNALRVRAQESPSFTTRASSSLISSEASAIRSLANWQGSAPRSKRLTWGSPFDQTSSSVAMDAAGDFVR